MTRVLGSKDLKGGKEGSRAAGWEKSVSEGAAHLTHRGQSHVCRDPEQSERAGKGPIGALLLPHLRTKREALETTTAWHWNKDTRMMDGKRSGGKLGPTRLVNRFSKKVPKLLSGEGKGLSTQVLAGGMGLVPHLTQREELLATDHGTKCQSEP